jgi:hypothetical protein
MEELRYTLLGNGSSDRRLLPLTTWVLQQHTALPIASSWADLGPLRVRQRDLQERIRTSVEYYPASLLFIHRDAEAATREERVDEIERALAGLGVAHYVPVVPIKMQETWLLFDEAAIRRAAGNPNGSQALHLPALHELERVDGAKHVLFEALRAASGLGPRRLERYSVHKATYRLAELIDDYSPLRRLSAFAALERDVCEALLSLGCASNVDR